MWPLRKFLDFCDNRDSIMLFSNNCSRLSDVSTKWLMTSTETPPTYILYLGNWTRSTLYGYGKGFANFVLNTRVSWTLMKDLKFRSKRMTPEKAEKNFIKSEKFHFISFAFFFGQYFFLKIARQLFYSTWNVMGNDVLIDHFERLATVNWEFWFKRTWRWDPMRYGFLTWRSFYKLR